ncbi:MAG: sugar transferase [Okeania sp. SIO2F4]|uniref:sugar transferase n=1 Tax=Okeania sp. SIO2F4 TaxID=2607790 RepID=UPI00142AEDCC|nr:sugar transferase [Okeania sp. SIO2F4]NES02420.1 sugar transferase [Okeania sp. SIO2F4]
MNSDVKLPTSLDDVLLPEELPPLVLTAFTRPDLLKDVLEGISQQSLLPSKMIAFVDGPRNVKDQLLIEKCISLLKDFSTLIPVDIVPRTNNLGCDQNVIRAFTEVLSSYDSLVYIEDDTMTNPYFYDRMCRLLEVYREAKQVCSISSYAIIPQEFDPHIDTDFITSNRVFSWGFAIWADQWKEIDLVNQSGQYNPFSSFYKIPATCQTKMTMINQFWLEKNKKTDWVITLTIAALYHQKVHIIPTTSFTYNSGFGHPESETYKGKEQAWVNARYDVNFCPNSLPSNLELPTQLKLSLSDIELARHLLKYKKLWLSPSAFIYLFKNAQSFSSMFLLLNIFITRLPIMLRRWRSGLPI